MANIKMDFANGDKLHLDGIKENKIDELIEYFKKEHADVKVSKVPMLDSEKPKTLLTGTRSAELSNKVSNNVINDSKEEQNKEQQKQKEYVKPEGEIVHNESNGFTIADSGMFDKLDLTTKVTKNQSELTTKTEESQSNDVEEVPNFYVTGYKETPRGRKYRASYLCPECGNKGKHYIPDYIKEISCHECDLKMKVTSVEKIMGVQKDHFNNWYVAGKFLPKDEDGKLVDYQQKELYDENDVTFMEIDQRPLEQIFFEENQKGKTQKEIASDYNVSASTVSRMIKKFVEKEGK